MLLSRPFLTSTGTVLIVAAALLTSACERSPPAPKLAAAARGNPTKRPAIARDAAARLDAAAAPLSPMALLGLKLFFDPRLSASGKMSCASCHDPNHAYAPANALAVQLGGPDADRQGARAVPTLTYLEHTPRFVIGPDAKPDEGVVHAKATTPAVKPPPGNGIAAAVPAQFTVEQIKKLLGAVIPQGGLDWDGRASALSDQAKGPLFDPNEMANKDGPALLAKLKAAPYAKDMIALFGSDVFSQPSVGLGKVYSALARYQIEDRSFHAYDSKFDYYLAGRAQLTEQELRGLELFDDPAKGNCAACHLDKPSKNRLAPVFTDYQFEALGAPRNQDLSANRDPLFFDEGLCGPARADTASEQRFCGLFKTPTLRNVATRKVFFHNGSLHSLDDAVRFYVERETRPEKWYPRKADGTVEMYDDLPTVHRVNVDVSDAPFNRRRGEQPALNDQEIEDVVAFLNTLTDGYRPRTSDRARAAPPLRSAATAGSYQDRRKSLTTRGVLERETRLELATSTLARLRSTN
jgi:cytochrome c peroxidase